MTKKHFIALAKIMAWYKDKIDPDVHAAMIGDLCHTLRHSNPLFDETRFKVACTATNLKGPL